MQQWGAWMSRIRVTFTYHGRIKAPFLQTGQEIAEYGFDRSALRNHKDQLILSGYQILGNLKHVLRGLFGITEKESAVGLDLLISGTKQDCKLSGEEFIEFFGQEEENALPAGVKLFDALLSRDTDPPQTITGIGAPETRSAQDPETGAVKDGFLVTSETHFAPEEVVRFDGSGYCLVSTMDDAKRLFRVLNWVAGQIVLLGADKTAGYGRALEFVFDTPTEKPLWALTNVAAARRYKFDVTSDRPLVLSPRKRSGNVLESLDYIPGDVMFGAVADWLKLSGKYDYFKGVLAEIRLLHCYPTKEGTNDRPVPVSWATTQNELVPAGLVLHRDSFRNDPVSSDGFSFVPERVFRTRTAVTEGDLTPKDEQLYTTSALSPEGVKWIGGLEWVGKDSPPDKFVEFAKALGAGLPRLGRTAAPVSITLHAMGEVSIAAETNVSIQLLSDAWMTNLQGAQDMHQIYESYFRCLLSEAVRLKDFAAIQANRTTPKFRNDVWPLTLTGSEFALIINDEARDKLNRLAQTGLPPFDAQAHFETCPFIRANGYGDFLVRT
ncbi:hypothetical protein [Sedimentitalea todarodis]|uniref:CRISPR-associated protein Csx10 n=1 Tax=Sedimentitalea todarodis TaxID=1631240 RepID=A0ABU3VEP2_9RHOB|nr:hypothetical protein [Sedimentitalea todarodis]MDU9004480.1 hypothetical protein [Sedimentitalea todarodis]